MKTKPKLFCIKLSFFLTLLVGKMVSELTFYQKCSIFPPTNLVLMVFGIVYPLGCTYDKIYLKSVPKLGPVPNVVKNAHSLTVSRQLRVLML